jgi:hypothetical protein
MQTCTASGQPVKSILFYLMIVTQLLMVSRPFFSWFYAADNMPAAKISDRKFFAPR